jgi:hypothetical protein
MGRGLSDGGRVEVGSEKGDIEEKSQKSKVKWVTFDFWLERERLCDFYDGVCSFYAW